MEEEEDKEGEDEDEEDGAEVDEVEEEEEEEDGEDFGEGEDEEENEMGSSTRDATGSDGATLDERSKFSANLMMLTGLELGYVVKTIEAQCPQAIEVGQQVPGKLEIVVDQLLSNRSLFAKLSEYAELKASQRRQKLPIKKAPTIVDISNRRKRKR